jgi:hypothetical protein
MGSNRHNRLVDKFADRYSPQTGRTDPFCQRSSEHLSWFGGLSDENRKGHSKNFRDYPKERAAPVSRRIERSELRVGEKLANLRGFFSPLRQLNGNGVTYEENLSEMQPISKD